MYYIYLAYLLTMINLNSTKILLPYIMNDFCVQINWLTWVVNSYTLLLSILLPICGRIIDIYGHRRYFIFGIVIFGLGSLLCGMASYFSLLIFGRLVQAVGAAFLIPASLALLLEKVTNENRGKALGIWGSTGAIGAVIGPITSGLLIFIFNWHGIFILLAVILFVLLIAVLCNMGLREKTKYGVNRQCCFDLIGALVLMVATTSIFVGITLLSQLGWSDYKTISCFASFILLISLFFRIERSAAWPLLDIDLLKKLGFSLGLLVCLLEQIVSSGTSFVLPIYFAVVENLSAFKIALLLIPTAAAFALVSPYVGWITNQFGFGVPISIGMLLRAFSCLMLSKTNPDVSYLFIVIFLTINGIGFGLASVPALNLLFTLIVQNHHGVVSGVYNMIRFIGQASGTTIAGLVLYPFLQMNATNNCGLNTSALVSGFSQVFLLLSAVCFLGFLIGIMISRV